MIEQSPKYNIFLSIQVSPATPWREYLGSLEALDIKEIAFFLDVASSDERREFYRLLEKSHVTAIPYVQVSAEMEAWEFDYLATNYNTVWFGLTVSNRSFGFLATVPKYADRIIFENPLERKYSNLFSDEALTRAGANGVCLDVATLERDRVQNNKKYTLSIHALDHHSLQVTQIRPVSNRWYRRFIFKEMRRLTSLTTLKYLKYVPPAQIAPLLVLDMDNTPEEQVEIREYLKTLLK